MLKVYRQIMLEKPIVENITKSQLIDDEQIFASLDLLTIKQEDLETFQSYNVKFVSQKPACNLHGFAFWFDVIFKTDTDIVTLSTSPLEPDTHWKQTIALLPNALDSFETSDKNNNNAQNNDQIGSSDLKENEAFSCFIIMNQSEENHRYYTIDIGVDLEKKSESSDEDIEEEDDEEHPEPCDCGALKCLIIKATLEKYEHEAKNDEIQ